VPIPFTTEWPELCPQEKFKKALSRGHTFYLQ